VSIPPNPEFDEAWQVVLRHCDATGHRARVRLWKETAKLSLRGVVGRFGIYVVYCRRCGRAAQAKEEAAG
jgi:hypothetical protein